MKTWREVAAPIIAVVIKDVGYDDLGKLKRALFDAYPFGPRNMHPYKIWCSEIRRQTGGRFSKAKPVTYTRRGDKLRPAQADDQLPLELPA